MVAGGSGITPMFQVASAILRNPWDATKVFLVYANVAERDILLREQLDAWARTERARFQVCALLRLNRLPGGPVCVRACEPICNRHISLRWPLTALAAGLHCTMPEAAPLHAASSLLRRAGWPPGVC